MRLTKVLKWCFASVVLGLAPPVAGDTFPGTNGATGADGTYVTGCWNDSGSVPSELTGHINYFNGLATDLNLVMGGCDGTTDMRFDDNLTASNLLGLHTCTAVGGDFGWTSSTSDIECETSTVQINPTVIATCGLNNSQVRRANWCHESGHGVGLGHETACMATGCFTTNVYSTHHIGHLASY